MINVLLFILLFLLMYFVVKKYFIKKQVSDFKKKSNFLFYAKEDSIKKLFSKFNFIKTKENLLFLQGYPLKLNAISYYLVKILLTFTLGLAGFMNYKSYIAAGLLSVLGYTFLDVYIFVNKKTRDAEICEDLMNVTDSISLELASFVPLDKSLKYQFQNCKNKDFRKAIMKLATNYELSEFNIETALNDLNHQFDILEVDMFCNTISQSLKVGNIMELLENLSSLLKEKYMDRLKDKTKTKVLYITFGVIIALGNIILITFYPLFITIGENFNQIFR